MSRIGKKPIDVPAGVTPKVDAGSRTVVMEGAKGRLSYQWHPEVSVDWNESDRQITCTIPEQRMAAGEARAQWGTTRARIQTMVTGVSDGYTRRLEIVGVGWNAKTQGDTLQLNIGFCHPVELVPPDGVEFKVEGNNQLTISGADKQAVGQFAAVVRSKRPPEPYNGKGIKYHDEQIARKQGKVFGA